MIEKPYSQSIWRKIQELCLSRLVSSSARKLDNGEHKKADHWILDAIGLALILAALAETTLFMASSMSSNLSVCSVILAI